MTTIIALALQKKQRSLPISQAVLYQGAALCLPPGSEARVVWQERAPRPASPAGVMRFPVLSAALTALACTLCLWVSTGSQPACTSEAVGRAAWKWQGRHAHSAQHCNPRPGLGNKLEADGHQSKTELLPLHLPDVKCLNRECNRKHTKYFLLDLLLKQRLILAVGLHLY